MLELTKAPRGLTHYATPGPSVISGILMMVAFSIWLYWQDIWVFKSWAESFQGLAALFGLSSGLAVSWTDTRDLAVSVKAPATMPSIFFSNVVAMAVAACAAIVSYTISENRVPARYGLRAIALVLGLPALGFFVLGIDPELNVEAHLAQLFKLGYWFMLCVPLVFALTAFVLPGNTVKRVALSFVAIAYFYFAVPVIALFHWQILTLLGAAWAPLLNIVFSILLLTFQLISFYGMIAAVDDN